MYTSIKILIAQTNPSIGDIVTNCRKIIQVINDNKNSHDLIIFPELALTGYLLEDLFFREELYIKVNEALECIKNACDNNCHVIVGHPQKIQNQIFNQASIFINSTCKITYSKQNLPNYGVFDEQRYFTASENKLPVFTIKEQQIKICICEDLWQSDLLDISHSIPTNILIAINASPFDLEKHAKRIQLCKKYASSGMAVIYVNQVGGQDEIIFDGASFALNPKGEIIAQAPQFIETTQTITIDKNKSTGQITKILPNDAAVYQAILLGLKDYVHKNNFKDVLLGLSGGIDSAVCLALAVDAFGASHVTAVLLPSQYTSDISNEDAIQMANGLEVKYFKLPIDSTYNCMFDAIEQITNDPNDLTRQNLQARIRGTLLMALSNNTNAMLICTSNKSETAVGYSTLYGDMIGGYSPLKDLFKTMVYQIANYRNKISEVIPKRIITRAPSAELAHEQKDEDTLPKYELLDPILELYIENNLTIEQITTEGYPKDVVNQVIQLLHNSEYKRRQSPLGPKVSTRAFGKDWRYPIAKKFK